MNKTYNKKTALITGASRGLGVAIAEVFAKNNCNVIINYNTHKEEALKVSDNIKEKYHVDTLAIKGDISNENDVKNIIFESLKHFKNIDYLINNAGISIDTTLEDKTVVNFKRILDVNLIGTFLMCKHVGTIMKNNKSGSIVNISSNNGIDSYYPYSMDYDASKAGVISLTHNFALEFAPYVHVNSIASGWINTEANKELDREFIAEECRHILLERFAEPSEIAESVYFAATATYLNDSILKIDGGHKTC